MTAIVLRNYQQQAVTATLQHFRHSRASAIIVLPTGAGKSLVIAELARLAKGNLLVLTHVQELVEQNHAKYEALGLRAGIFSAGLNRRDTNHQITFASIQSMAHNLHLFSARFSLVIIDECHRVSADKDTQYQTVIQHLRSNTPSLKLLGLTATPYRLGQGWIYQYDYRGFVRDSLNPAFEYCIYELPLSQLIREGYLTAPVCIDAALHHYDFSSVDFSDPERSNSAVNQLLTKYPRVTQAITEEVIQLAASRKGVMMFAASVEHAQEILRYLPANASALITGTTPTAERQQLIEDFKRQQIKFLVNVSVLTTGFDAPHVDLIAILRPTQSVSLYQQIAGRGLRLYPDKKDCLIIDYAANGFNLYSPEVGSPKPAADTVPVQVFCPKCQFANLFWGRVDHDGHVTEHFGRRCHGLDEESTPPKQCDFRFQFKECRYCQHENDIAARRCEKCNKLLIDPDDLLKQALSLKNCKVMRCAGMTFEQQASTLVITYHDEEGDTLKEFFDMDNKGQRSIFKHQFGRRYLQGTYQDTTLDIIIKQSQQFKHPDFVIAKQKKHFWKVEDKIFDYQGRYRKAHELH